MGIRFRKSVTIIPGLRLNLTKSGLSATLGPRGASIGIGPRGTHANLGGFGTGLSLRTRLDAPASRRGARTSLRTLAKELRAVERERAKAAAAHEHSEQSALFDRLYGIIRDRERESFDWDAVCSEQSFLPTEFRPVHTPIQERDFRLQAQKQHRVGGWIAVMIVALGLGLLIDDRYARMLMLGVIAIGILGTRRLFERRHSLAKRLLVQRQLAVRREVEAAKAQHESAEDERRRMVEAKNARAQRLKTSIAAGEASSLAELLEEELSNENLPIPLLFEISFEGIDTATIEVSLPDLDIVPSGRTELTKTGKVSYRKVNQRDRTSLYADVCAALALRLVYETLRVLPVVNDVEVVGTSEQVNPATGQEDEFVALHVRTTRASFEGLDLDRVDPTAALEGLGGRLAYERTGELRPLADVQGLRS